MWRTTKGLAGYNVARPRQLDVNQRPETIGGLIGLGGRQLREIGRRLDVKSDTLIAMKPDQAEPNFDRDVPRSRASVITVTSITDRMAFIK